MAKLTREDKIEIYKKRKNGITISHLTTEYGVAKKNITYLIRLIDYHGEDILRDKTNRYYSKELKQEIIDQVLFDKRTVNSVAIEYGLLNDGILFNWIKSYKENNYVIVEKKRGRKTTAMTKIKDKEEINKYDSMSSEDKIKHLENKVLYLEADNEYLKKLRAVIQKKKQQQKKK